MKTLTEYNIDKEFDLIINEGLFSGLGKFFSKLYKGIKKLIKSNKKIDLIDVEEDKMNKSKDPIKFEILNKTKEFKEFIDDDIFGFSTLNQIMNNPNKYLQYNKEIKYNPVFYKYFTKYKNTIIDVGIIGYDEKIKIFDNYLTLFIVESSLIVKDSTKLNKFMIENLKEEIQIKDKNIKGFISNPVHQKLKADYIKTGFKSSNENKEILYYNF